MNGSTWSQSELERLAKLYPSRPTREIAQRLKRSLASTYNAAFKLGLKKTAERRRECGLQKGHSLGRESQFPKGHVPANKGLRRPGYAPGRMKETQFGKGCRSGIAATNWKPVGTILADTDGYLRIKVREAQHGKEATGFGNTKVWPLYNRYLWEQQKGPIPPKHIVIFKDGKRANCVIENLELLSMADNARRNAMWRRYPAELAQAIMLNGALKRKLGRLDGKE